MIFYKFVVLVLTFASYIFSEPHLISVHVVSRHGDRNPSFPLPVYSGKNINYDLELTLAGVKRMKNIGSSLKSRYFNDILFPSKYVDGKFKFYSTYTHRTKQSLYSISEGLFSTVFPTYNNMPVFDNDKYQPIPIVSKKYERDFDFLAQEICFFFFFFFF
jgi:hypothetical protein